MYGGGGPDLKYNFLKVLVDINFFLHSTFYTVYIVVT